LIKNRRAIFAVRKVVIKKFFDSDAVARPVCRRRWKVL